jgi:PPOX class probable F420-dependent enzyme
MSQSSAEQPSPATTDVARHLTMPFASLDSTTPIGQAVIRRLRDEQLIWLTTVDEHGIPHPLPVTFLWDAAQASFLTYSRTDRGRLADLEHNATVALHFDVSGGDIIVITGTAIVSNHDLPSDQIPEWVEKYRDLLARLGMSAKQSAASASVPIRIRPVTLRYAPNPLA